MPAAYDNFDYPSYWEGREYEHESEVLAISSFLKSIEKIGTVVEVGAGFGRLTPSYEYRAKKLVLTDPSANLLKQAKTKHHSKKSKFIQTSIENLSKKIRANTADLTIFVRVLHHIKDPKKAIKTLSKITRPKGYIILEFANKAHFKANIREALKGDFTYLLDIFPKEVGGKQSKKKTIPFFNFHPDKIEEYLKDEGFTILERRSVSNVRSTFLKKRLPLALLLSLEKIFQKPLASLNFGPSIFLLAKKR